MSTQANGGIANPGEGVWEEIDEEIERAIEAEGQANFDYFIAHAEELFQQHPGKMIVVYAGGTAVRACSSPDELHELLNSLTEVQRSGALYHGQRDPSMAYVL